MLPPCYWWLSIAGSSLVLVYSLQIGDPTFIAGTAVNLCLFIQNVRLYYGQPTARRHVIILLLLVLTGCAYLVASNSQSLWLDHLHPAWIAIGILGQGLWISRFVIQWWKSQSLEKSVLPVTFWWVSLIGSLLCLSYAIAAVNWVFILSFSLNSIPLARNLMLSKNNPSNEVERVCEYP